MTVNGEKDPIDLKKIYKLLDDSFYLDCLSSCSESMKMDENPDYQCFTFIFDDANDLLTHLACDRKIIRPRVINGMTLESAKKMYSEYNETIAKCRPIFKKTKDIIVVIGIFSDFEAAEKNNFELTNMDLNFFGCLLLEHQPKTRKSKRRSGKKVVFRNGKLVK